MWKLLERLIVGALGVVAGWKFKDILEKINVSKPIENTNNNRPDTLSGESDKDVSDNRAAASAREAQGGFNLHSIAYLFADYGVELVGVNSFAILLRAIENKTYIQILRRFVADAKSPEALYDLLQQGSSKDIVIRPQPASTVCLLTDSVLDKLIVDRKVDLGQHQVSPQDKVQLLISYAATKGLKSFQSTMGNSLSEFVEKYESKEDASLLYREIYSNIKDALNFLDD